MAGSQSRSHSVAWRRTERQTDVCRSPESSGADGHGALGYGSSLFLGKGDGAAPPGHRVGRAAELSF